MHINSNTLPTEATTETIVNTGSPVCGQQVIRVISINLSVRPRSITITTGILEQKTAKIRIASILFESFGNQFIYFRLIGQQMIDFQPRDTPGRHSDQRQIFQVTNHINHRFIQYVPTIFRVTDIHIKRIIYSMFSLISPTQRHFTTSP